MLYSESKSLVNIIRVKPVNNYRSLGNKPLAFAERLTSLLKFSVIPFINSTTMKHNRYVLEVRNRPIMMLRSELLCIAARVSTIHLPGKQWLPGTF